MKIEKFKVLLYLKAALPEKERNGQVGQSPDNGSYHGEPHDGAVRLQTVVQAGVMEREGKPSGRQEPRGGGNQRKIRQAAALGHTIQEITRGLKK